MVTPVAVTTLLLTPGLHSC